MFYAVTFENSARELMEPGEGPVCTTSPPSAGVGEQALLSVQWEKVIRTVVVIKSCIRFQKFCFIECSFLGGSTSNAGQSAAKLTLLCGVALCSS